MDKRGWIHAKLFGVIHRPGHMTGKLHKVDKVYFPFDLNFSLVLAFTYAGQIQGLLAVKSMVW